VRTQPQPQPQPQRMSSVGGGKQAVKVVQVEVVGGGRVRAHVYQFTGMILIS